MSLQYGSLRRIGAANDTWVKRVSSKKTTCGTWSSLFSLPVKELEFNQIGRIGQTGGTGKCSGEVFKSGGTGFSIRLGGAAAPR